MESRNGQADVRIVEVTADVVRALELEGLMCFRCPLLEDMRLPEPGAGKCRIRADDLLPVIGDEKSGVRMLVRQEQILGYAVFGRPKVFRNLRDLPFSVRDDALLIAALYVTDEAREKNLDVDLLLVVMDFARNSGFELVQAVCRPGGESSPEARVELLQAAGFEASIPVKGFCLAETTVEAWDSDGKSGE